MFTRVAGFAGLAALSLACGGPATSPFFLWDARPGMPLDSVEQIFRERDLLGQNRPVWERCTAMDGGGRRCSRTNFSPQGQFDIVAGADGRVVFLSFAPGTRSKQFDDSLSRMQVRWSRARGVKLDPHGVSETNPRGIAEMRSGRWRAFMTFDGKVCEGTTLPCPALIQLVDWRAGRQYADMSVPKAAQ